jgi:hypothetical protein
MTVTSKQSRGHAGRCGCVVTRDCDSRSCWDGRSLPAEVEEQKATALSSGESGLPDGSRSQAPEVPEIRRGRSRLG